jgi:uncharacterized protein
MLLSFRFANHRSFRDETQLMLTPVYEDDYVDGGELAAVPVIGIFGSNASGKSNVLDALGLMRFLVVNSDRRAEPGGGVARRDPFRLDPAVAREPSRYTVDLVLDTRYTYGLAIDDGRVVEEWLYSYPYRKKRVIFERTGDAFEFGDESKRTALPKAREITAPNALFLSVAARANQEAVAAVYLWFWRRVRLSLGIRSSRPMSSSTAWAMDAGRRAAVADLLRAADVGLREIRVERSPQEEENLLYLLEREGEAALDRIQRLRHESPLRLRFVHDGAVGDAMLELRDESVGTRQLMDLAVTAFAVLDVGGLLAVDEIDASLHPLLTAKIIAMFQSPVSNPRRAQLLLTSHDASLLGVLDGEEVLRRDQIWFTDKDSAGVSTLYPLSDFRPRKGGENRVRRYLNGSYDAVPRLDGDVFVQVLAARGDLGGDQVEG